MTEITMSSMTATVNKAAKHIIALREENQLLYELLVVQRQVIVVTRGISTAKEAGNPLTHRMLLEQLLSLESKARGIGEELTAHTDAQ